MKKWIGLWILIALFGICLYANNPNAPSDKVREYNACQIEAVQLDKQMGQVAERLQLAIDMDAKKAISDNYREFLYLSNKLESTKERCKQIHYEYKLMTR